MKALLAVLLIVASVSAASGAPACPKISEMRSVCYKSDPDYLLAAPHEKDCPHCYTAIQACARDFISKSHFNAISLAVRKLGETEMNLPIEVQSAFVAQGVNAALVRLESMREKGKINGPKEFREQWDLMEAIANSCDQRRKAIVGDIPFVCGIRLNKDLWKYKVLDGWPGCACSNGTGRMIAGVCLQGIAEKSLIDERVPRAMERFLEKMREWGHAQPERLEISSANFLGCTSARPSRNDPSCNRKGASVNTDPNCKDAFEPMSLKDVSPHAEGRGCDLASLTFEARNGPQVFRVGGADGFSAALANLLSDPPMRTRFMSSVLTIPANNPQNRIPTGVPDFDKFWKTIEGQPKPNFLKTADWSQLQTGVAVEKALIDSGFFVLDGFSDSNHLNHFHLSVPMTEQEWQILDANQPVGSKLSTVRAALCAKLGMDPAIERYGACRP